MCSSVIATRIFCLAYIHDPPKQCQNSERFRFIIIIIKKIYKAPLTERLNVTAEYNVNRLPGTQTSRSAIAAKTML